MVTSQGRLKLLLLGCMLVATSYGSSPQVQVLIGKSVPVVKVKGHFHYETQTKRLISLDCRPLQKNQHAQIVSEIKPLVGLLQWNGKHLEGDLLITRLPQRRSCQVINRLPLEDYLATLLAKEMNAKWPLEALKAQAVAARSYAFHKMRKGKARRQRLFYDLINSEQDQVSGSFLDKTAKTMKATEQTYGEILVSLENEIVPIFFHARCGGRTVLPQHVWEKPVVGYESVECPSCHEDKTNKWSYKATLASLNRQMSQLFNRKGKPIGKPLTSSYPLGDTLDRSLLRFYDGEQNMRLFSKAQLRNFFGVRRLRSSRFRVQQKGAAITFKGKGHGHGVGLCQVGAMRLAQQGWSYQEILKHYYPNFKIIQAYQS